ncbi:MAG: hypothetical protein ABIF77_14070 [bacterium]
MQASGGADPQGAGFILNDVGNRMVTALLELVGIVMEMNEATGVAIEFIQAVACANPESLGSIFENDVDVIVSQAAGVGGIMPVPDERAICPIERIQTESRRADPESPFMIFENRGDRVAAQGVRVIGIVLVAAETLTASIEDIQTSRGPDPDIPRAIFHEGVDVVVAEAGGYVRSGSKDSDLVPIEPVQPVLGAKPHEPSRVLEDAPDRGLGKPVLDPEVQKSRILPLRVE